MKKLSLLLVIIAILPIVTASYISIQSSITTTEDGTMIKVTNLGDEAAYNVQLSLDINNKKTISSVKERLDIQKSFEWKVPLAAKLKNPGKYPLILTTNYQDVNSYPFSAISVSAFDYKQGTISDIASKINNIELSDEGTLELTIKNLAETAKNIDIRLIVPKELTADKDKLRVKLPAKRQTTINFEIEKFSALTGSSYVVFAVIEYNEDNMHYTAMSSGVVKIIEKVGINIKNNFLFITLAILIIIFVFLRIKNSKKFLKVN